jgi:hypothetical protein
VKIDRASKASGGHQPGHAYKRNFNAPPSGRFGIRMHRPAHSRAKSSRGAGARNG